MNAAVTGDFSRFSLAGGRPLNHGLLKQECEDFQVDEVLGFQPTGAGEHLFLQLRKRDLGTPEVVGRLATLLGIRRSAIGYSGMKDRRAVSTQWFSVPAGQARALRENVLLSAGLELLDVQENQRKLRLGSHRANHFRIRLREFSGKRADLEARVAAAIATGLPNYFGPQRLGKGFSNVVQAQEYFRGLDEERVGFSLPRSKHSMLLSASRSFLFNLILSRRVQEGSWNRLLPGEVLNLAGTQRFFKPPTGGADSEESALIRRLNTLDVHPTGLLAGRVDEQDPYLASDEVARLEADTITDYPLLLNGLERLGVQAARRPLRLVPVDLLVQYEEDGSLILEFSLAAGGYATAVIRELVQCDGV
jgi:tRNA pseudouridine13 synthase